MPNLAIAFQPNLLGVMSQFSQFHEVLQKHMATATEKSAGAIGNSGQAFMNFKNPTGNLHDSIEVIMLDPYHAWIGSQVVYARRREFGFSGMTDSLGRYYPLDPGMFYMTNAITNEETLLEVAGYYIEAVYGAWEEAIGRLPMNTIASVGVV